MLKVEQLNQYYGQSHTLWDLNLDVPEGKCTVLMGRNGVGKTTLLQCIMGLLPVKTGSMHFGDKDLRKVAAEERAAMGLGYVPQGRQIFPLLTVEENLLIGLPARRDGLKKVPDFIYEMFPVLKEMLGRRGGDRHPVLRTLRPGPRRPDQRSVEGRQRPVDPALTKKIGIRGNFWTRRTHRRRVRRRARPPKHPFDV